MSFFEEEELDYEDNLLLSEAPEEKTTNEGSAQTRGNIAPTNNKNANNNQVTDDVTKSAKNENHVAAQQEPRKLNKKKGNNQSRCKISKMALTITKKRTKWQGHKRRHLGYRSVRKIKASDQINVKL
uniref:Uncharacterized protein n=1 Tax=Romanomermis culicivorax TaxID=13658 RepID=A0A915K213_ROMCU